MSCVTYSGFAPETAQVAVWVLDGLCASGWTGEADPATLRDLETARLFSPAELHRLRTCVRVPDKTWIEPSNARSFSALP